MRIIHVQLILAVLSLLPRPAMAEFYPANDWTSAAPYDQCPVAPLPWFTQAEAWAWQQICLDRGAYMRSVGPDDPREKCHVDPALASPYGDEISARFLLVVNSQEPFISHIPAHTTFFACPTVPQDLSFGGMTAPLSLNIYGAHFMSSVSFRNARIDGELNLRFSDFNDSAVFDGLESPSGLFLEGSTFQEGIDLEGIDVASLVLRGSTVFGEVRAQRAKVRRNFVLDNSNLYGPDARLQDFLEAEAPSVKKTPNIGLAKTASPEALEVKSFLRQGLPYVKSDEARRALRLADAKIGGNLSLYESRVYGSIDGVRLDVGSGIYAHNTIFGEINLSQAEIAHDVDLSNSIGYLFKGLTAKVGGNVFLKDTRISKVDFLDANIDGGIFAEGAAVDKLEFGRSVVGGSVHLRSAFANPGTYDEVSFIGATIGQDLQLQGSIYTGPVKLKGLFVGEDLVLYQSGLVPVWGSGSSLDLSAAQVDRLSARMPFSWAQAINETQTEEYQDVADQNAGAADQPIIIVELIHQEWTDVWSETCNYEFADKLAQAVLETSELIDARAIDVPRCASLISDDEEFTNALTDRQSARRLGDVTAYVPLDLFGFEYRYIDERVRDYEYGYGEALDVDRLVEWLRASGSREGDQGQQLFVPRYQPTAYRQLADMLAAQGYIHKAERVEIAMHLDRMRSYSFTLAGIFLFSVDAIWGILTVFGIYPAVAVGWFMLIVAIGTLLARKYSGPPGIWWDDEASDDGLAARPTRWSCFWYSIENALPLVDLTEDQKRWQHRYGWVRSFFHFQRIAGFILATVIVGALTLG